MSEYSINAAIERQMRREGFDPGYHAYVELEEPTLDYRTTVSAPLRALNAWVRHQVGEGRDVMEHEQHTGVRRMRPLRPDDV